MRNKIEIVNGVTALFSRQADTEREFEQSGDLDLYQELLGRLTGVERDLIKQANLCIALAALNGAFGYFRGTEGTIRQLVIKQPRLDDDLSVSSLIAGQKEKNNADN